MKKAICVAMSLLLVLSILPMFLISSTALTSGDWEYNWYHGNSYVQITKYNGTATEVVVPESLNDINVANLSNTAFAGKNIKQITVNGNYNLSSDRYGAFKNCPNLLNIKVSANNTYCCDVDGILFSKNMQSLCKYPSGRTTKSYSIPSGASLSRRFLQVF